MLTVEQQGYATWLVSDGERQVTQLTRFAGTPFLIDGHEYRFGLDGPRDVLEGPLGVAAVAFSSGRGEITVIGEPHELRLRRLTWSGRRWAVHSDEQLVGTCRVGMLAAAGDLPAELPLSLRVFALYTLLSRGSFLSFRPGF